MIKWNTAKEHFDFTNINIDEARKILAWYIHDINENLEVSEGCSLITVEYFLDLLQSKDNITFVTNPDGNTVQIVDKNYPNGENMLIHSIEGNGAVYVAITSHGTRRKLAVSHTILKTWQFNELMMKEVN